MTNRITITIILLIILTSFFIGIFLYPKMPSIIASHWNTEGQVNGFITKFWALFLMPFISLLLFLLFILIPKIDPLRENIKKFIKYYNLFILFIILFLFYLYLLTIFWNLGFIFNMNLALTPAFAILFYCAGNLIKNAKRNWFIGIRTPWTLSNDKVWDETHKIGGNLFKAVGIIALLGVFFPNYAIFFLIIPAIIVSVYTFIFSYFEYQKEIKKIK